jgi:hypothetical protein
MQTNLGRKDWIAIAVCMGAVPLFTLFPHPTSIATTCWSIGGVWMMAAAWLEDWRPLRRTIPQIYTDFRRGTPPQQRWLPRMMTWGATVWCMAAVMSWVV